MRHDHDRHAPFGPHHHGPEGRGPRRRMFDAGELRLVLLHFLAERPRHGYELIQALEEVTAGSYAPSPGVIYPTLTLLQDMDLIAESESTGPRKVYAITAAGQAELAGAAAQVDLVLARLKALADPGDRPDAMPVRRAMENLKTVLRNRLPAADRDTVLAVAALIDEAAQKIERL